MTNKETRQWCIRRLIEANAHPNELVKLAEDMVRFVNEGEEELVPAKELPPIKQEAVETVQKVKEKKVVPWVPELLTSTQRSVLRLAIDMHLNGKKVNGTNLARESKLTQSNLSLHLRNLAAKGYLRRPSVQRYVPIRTPNGEEIEYEVVQKLPSGSAEGYKPLTQNLGTKIKAARVG